MRRIFLVAAGMLLVVVGVAGLVLPILPGWALIFLGLSFIAPRHADRLKMRLFRRFMKKELVVLEDWLRFGVRAGFTTKRCPVFLQKTEDLTRPDKQKEWVDFLRTSSVARHHRVPASERAVFLNQVHGGTVRVIDSDAGYSQKRFYRLESTDGVLTNVRGLSLIVLTADCLPIFFCSLKKDSRGKTVPDWVGLVHAGWRGTQAGIAETAFCEILRRSGCSPADIRVTFGPAIGKKVYEVGPEFKELFPAESLPQNGLKLCFDLAGENRRRLVKAGLPEANLFDPEICTASESGDFYSFRTEKEAAGRIISFITKP